MPDAHTADATAGDAGYEEILYEVDDPVATVTLHRPEQLNAWTPQMEAEVKHAMARAEADPAVVGIVLTGSGRGFCAGADLNVLSGIAEGDPGVAASRGLGGPEPGDPSMDDFRGTYTYLMSIRKPVVAAINGPVAGMAFPISLCCDLRFAAESAVFTTSFARRGLIAEWGSAWLLPRLVGTAHALDLLFSARRIGAAEAAQLGLVNRVVPDDELLSHTRDYLCDLAENCSPASIAVMKRQVYSQLAAPLGPSEKEAASLMFESFQRPDFAEGVNAFLQRRPPSFERI